MCSHVQRGKLSSIYSCHISCHILFLVLDKHKWCSNKHTELPHRSFPVLPLWPQHFSTFLSAPSIALLFITLHTCNLPSLSSPSCPACSKSHPKFRESISLLLLISMARSPSTIILNMHFFMCPFSFGTGSPKTSTKPFHFSWGFLLPWFWRKCQLSVERRVKGVTVVTSLLYAVPFLLTQLPGTEIMFLFLLIKGKCTRSLIHRSCEPLE